MEKHIIPTITATLGAIAGFLFGELDGLMYALIAVIIIDYITGILVAVANKNLSSEIGFKGIVKKILMFSLVALGNIVDVHIVGNGAVFRTTVLFVLLGNEGISIIENAAALGTPIPEKLMLVFKQIKSKGNNESEKKNDDEN